MKTLLSVLSLAKPQFFVHEVKELVAAVTRHSGKTICAGSDTEIFRGNRGSFFFSRVGKSGRGKGCSGAVGAAAVCAGRALVVLRDRLMVTWLLRHRSNVAGVRMVEV